MISFPVDKIVLFVYGNLRPGMRLWPSIEPYVKSVQPATLVGDLFWHEDMTYPLLDAEQGETFVAGEILEIALNPATSHFLVQEELLYGYEARWLELELDDGTVREALVMTWPWDKNRGKRITSGDYTQEVPS